MMSFDEFCIDVKNNVGDYISMLYDFDEIVIRDVTKNNGVTYTGLIVKRSDSDISPNIYLEGYYDAYVNGEPMEKVMTEITKSYHMACVRAQETGQDIISDIASSDYYYQNAYVRVVNYARNKDIALTCPVKKELDLMATLRLKINMTDDSVASCQIKTEDILKLDLDVNKLWKCAMENTNNFYPTKSRHLYDVVQDMMDEEIPDSGEDIYVVTNTVGIGGAGAMMYNKEAIADVAENVMGSNVYILPSSIHEVLLVRADSPEQAKDLQQMVMEINAAVVSKEEVLSNSVYKYDRDSKEISIAAKDPMIKEKTKDREIGE